MRIQSIKSANRVLVFACVVFAPGTLSARAQRHAESASKTFKVVQPSTRSRAAVQDLVQPLLSAILRRNLAAANGLWAARSTHNSEFAQLVREDLFPANAVEVRIQDVRYSRCEYIKVGLLTRLRFVCQWRDLKTKRPSSTKVIWNVTCVPEGRRWRLLYVGNAKREFVSQLYYENNKVRRHGIIKANHDLISVELVHELVTVGHSEAQNGQGNKVLKMNEVVMGIAEALPNEEDRYAQLASCWNFRGTIFRDDGNAADAEKCWRQALRFFRALRTPRSKVPRLSASLYNFSLEGEALMLSNLAETFSNSGRSAEAISLLKRSLQIQREQKSVVGEAMALGNLGGAYTDLNRLDEAMSIRRVSLKMFEQLGPPFMVSRAIEIRGIADIDIMKGRYGDALAGYQKSLELVKDSGSPQLVVSIGVKIAKVNNLMGRYKEATQRLLDLVPLVERIRYVNDRAEVASVLGTTLIMSGRPQEGVDLCRYSIRVEASAGRSPRLDTANTLVHGLIALNHLGDALEFCQALTPIARAHREPVMESLSLMNHAQVLLLKRDYPEALAKLKEARSVRMPEQNTKREIERQIDETLGVLYRRQKRWNEAVAAYGRAIQAVERMRTDIRERSLQTSFLGKNTSPYLGLAASLSALGRDQEAFAVSERAKSRSLIDVMQSGNTDLRTSMSAREKQRERNLRARVENLTRQLDEQPLSSVPSTSNRQARQNRIAALEKRLATVRTELDEFRQQLFLSHPDLKKLRGQFHPASGVAINRTIFARSPDLCVLSYLVDGDETLLFVLQAGPDPKGPSTLTIHRLPIRAEMLRDKVIEFQALCASKSKPPYQNAARVLYQILLAPVEHDLAGKRLIIVPDDILHALPFQCLMTNNKHLIETNALSYAPSVSALLEIVNLEETKKNRHESPRYDFVALGRPSYNSGRVDLEATEDEVEEIAKLFPLTERRKVLTGKAATKNALKQFMSQTRYLHLAAHGLLSQGAPLYSAIILADDAKGAARLEAQEIAEMNLQAELVVLSACDSGRGEQVSGEGLLGLSWALFAARTPTIIVTQWKVDDVSTKELMVDFYHNLLAATPTVSGSEGHPQDEMPLHSLTKAEALRRAQMLLIGGTYRHPYYWAPFILVGGGII